MSNEKSSFDYMWDLLKYDFLIKFPPEKEHIVHF